MFVRVSSAMSTTKGKGHTRWTIYAVSQIIAFLYSFAMYDHDLAILMRAMSVLGFIICARRIWVLEGRQ